MDKPINVRLIQTLRGTSAGEEFLRWIDAAIVERRREFETGNVSANDAGSVGWLQGSLETLHLINETLLGEYQGETEEVE